MKRFLILLLLTAMLFGCGQQAPGKTQATSAASATQPTEVPSQAVTTTATETTEGIGFDPCAIISQMTLEEKVGQLFLARCPDLNAVGQIGQYHFGGYVLFGKDFEYENPTTMQLILSDYQEASKIPMLLAVDEEGGTVTRVSYYSAYRESRFPSPRNAWEDGGLTGALAIEEEKCQLLKSIGLNVNLAPVCDISTDPESFIYDRSLGQDAQTTAQFIASTVTLMQQHGIGSTLKHFPGYGGNADTHLGIALDTRTLEELEGCDLIPFQAGIDAGCGAIMVSHTFVKAMDSDYPASLSPVVHSYIRQNMGFHGVIMTDDLSMTAIKVLYGAGEAGVLAFLAGNDILCTSDYEAQYPAILEAVANGRITESQIDSSVARILQWKYDLGLITE